MTVTDNTRQEGAAVDISPCGPLPPGGGLSFKCMLAEGRERRPGLDWIVAGVVLKETPGPLHPAANCAALTTANGSHHSPGCCNHSAEIPSCLLRCRQDKVPPSSPCEAVHQPSPERVTIEIAGARIPTNRVEQPSHLIARCTSMRVDAASRCPPAPPAPPHWSRLPQ
jgi:hypothetical protein